MEQELYNRLMAILNSQSKTVVPFLRDLSRHTKDINFGGAAMYGFCRGLIEVQLNSLCAEFEIPIDEGRNIAHRVVDQFSLKVTINAMQDYLNQQKKQFE